MPCNHIAPVDNGLGSRQPLLLDSRPPSEVHSIRRPLLPSHSRQLPVRFVIGVLLFVHGLRLDCCYHMQNRAVCQSLFCFLFIPSYPLIGVCLFFALSWQSARKKRMCIVHMRPPGFYNSMPPVISTMLPMANSLLSLASIATMLAISDGRPALPIGIVARRLANSSLPRP